MRIAKANLHKVAWYLKPFFWAQKKKYGKALDSAYVWAKNPKLFFGVSLLFGFLDRKKSPLPARLRSLVIVQVSHINGCPFCIDLNSSVLIKRAGNEAILDELKNWQSSTVITDSEKAALDYAQKITDTSQDADDTCFSHLQKYFNEKQIIELTALIAFQNLSSKFNRALRIEPQGFCKCKKKE